LLLSDEIADQLVSLYDNYIQVFSLEFFKTWL